MNSLKPEIIHLYKQELVDLPIITVTDFGLRYLITFFLEARPLTPPPLLVAGPLKKNNFFAASLTPVNILQDFFEIYISNIYTVQQETFKFEYNFPLTHVYC